MESEWNMCVENGCGISIASPFTLNHQKDGSHLVMMPEDDE